MIEIDSYLYDKSRITKEMKNGTLDDWKVKIHENFYENIIDPYKKFPCYFAVNSEKNGWSRYLFVNSAYDENELLKMKDGVYEYIKSYKKIAKRTTLVIFFKPTMKKMLAEDYKKQFWHVLNYLLLNDPEPWNSKIPRDPNNIKWEFCFAGEPIFVVCRAPFYSDRKSRYTEQSLEITLQPRGTLDDITGDTKQGKKIRELIRGKLLEYDDIAIHPDIGDYGENEKYEWKQYILPETNEESVTKCPLTTLEKTD
ncbi:YqcI/YcgG family protein [Bacillus thuringiensis]|uniref:YqcI/YcgG family protein n=1 Tax=Bacillus thuringiensis TaxID=1428 RepID=UPI000E492FEA|nr:YqcI/YcgG family protein [Bacillus thuringiensis]MDZ3952297.1 YqcI/YcgG family protein [Bacillus thuringiensis]RGP53425.1 hypothetical protein BTW32_09820 [Bacillus thuringiensis]